MNTQKNINIKKVKDEDGDTSLVIREVIDSHAIEISIDCMGEVSFSINGSHSFNGDIPISLRMKILRFAYRSFQSLVKEWEQIGGGLREIYAIPQDEQGGIPDNARRALWLNKIGLKKRGEKRDFFIIKNGKKQWESIPIYTLK